MKRFALTTMATLMLAGCGLDTGLFASDTTSVTAQTAAYQVLALDGTEATASTQVNPDARAQDAFARLDTDGDGNVSFLEFQAGFQQRGKAPQARPCMDALDENGDGALAQGELRGPLQGRGGERRPPRGKQGRGGEGMGMASGSMQPRMGSQAPAASSSASFWSYFGLGR